MCYFSYPETQVVPGAQNEARAGGGRGRKPGESVTLWAHILAKNQLRLLFVRADFLIYFL